MEILKKINAQCWYCILILLLNTISSYGQGCESIIELQLKNIDGGVFANQKVTLTSKTDGKTYSQNSDGLGIVSFDVPCNILFDVAISNYSDKNEIKSKSGGRVKQILSYEADMLDKTKDFAMSPAEKIKVDQSAKQLPDTTFIIGSRMTKPTLIDHYVKVNFVLNNIHGLPLDGETVVFTANKHNKHFKGTTDKAGNIMLYLVKGDKYSINFHYHKKFASYEFDYSKGSSNVDISISYLGTKEVERRKKEEALRILQEEKRLREEREKFAAECKKQGITIEEGYRRELRKSMFGIADTVVINVLNRNKWTNKLIICDLTCSMHPYAAQLSAWYQLNIKKENNLQFVFFSEGDRPTEQKIIGETGGIFYSAAKGLDSLSSLMARVIAVGCSGDCPENDMEALIKGVKMAKPFNEAIAIVDNNAPVRDISLLKNFNHPVHIILCGATDGWVLEDYLLIAWKTKGSIHTIEQDITSIASMSEGQEIRIGKISYRIMGGEFVRINKT
jgi:hypothetical protein